MNNNNNLNKPKKPSRLKKKRKRNAAATTTTTANPSGEEESIRTSSRTTTTVLVADNNNNKEHTESTKHKVVESSSPLLIGRGISRSTVTSGENRVCIPPSTLSTVNATVATRNDSADASATISGMKENSFLRFVATKKKEHKAPSRSSLDICDKSDKKEDCSRTTQSHCSSVQENNVSCIKKGGIQLRQDPTNDDDHDHRDNHSNEKTSSNITKSGNITTKTNTKNKPNFRSPIDILEIETINYSNAIVNNDDANNANSNTNAYESHQHRQHLLEERTFRKNYYDAAYYSLIVDHLITKDYHDHCQNINHIENVMSTSTRQESLTDNHPILGSMHLLEQIQSSTCNDISTTFVEDDQVLHTTTTKTTDKNFLVWPKLCKRNQSIHHEKHPKKLKLGSNLMWNSFVLPKPSSQHLIPSKPEKKKKNCLGSDQLQTNLPIPMKTNGKLKIVCYQGATVRSDYNIDKPTSSTTTSCSTSNRSTNVDNKKLCTLFKDDIREFVDVKWLSPYTFLNDEGMGEGNMNYMEIQDCMYEGECALNGVLRYKIKLLDEDVLHKDKEEGCVYLQKEDGRKKSVDNEKATYGWISDRSRLKDDPYWIAIVL